MYVLKSKMDCFKKFKEFKGSVEMKSKYKIKIFMSGNGGESILKTFNQFLRDRDIVKQTCTLYMPQQNGVVERANCTTVEMTKNILHAQKLDKSVLPESVANAVLYTKPMSNNDVRFHYARRNIKYKDAMHCTHACICVRCLCNGAGYKWVNWMHRTLLQPSLITLSLTWSFYNFSKGHKC